MIVKSLRHSSKQASSSVKYLMDGIPVEKEKQWLIFRNITSGYDQDSIIMEFNESANLLRISPNRKTTVRYHEILGFSHKDIPRLTREKSQVIANEYLGLRDPENFAKALCVPHKEKDGHPHIHILLTSNSVGSSRSGDLMMSNARYYDIRRDIERFMLQTYPELHQSIVYLTEKEIRSLLPEKYQTERRMMELEQPKPKKETVKDQVSIKIKSLLEKSNSLNDFIDRINKQSAYQTYSRRGKLTGVILQNNKKFRFSTLGINLLDENFSVLSRMNELETLDRKTSKEIER